jgi:VIT1/CCC1 family predicted Fe2+/Mn2+ transporter
VAAVTPVAATVAIVSTSSLVLLATLGAVAARAGGASMGAGALRMLLWGAFALAATAGIGALIGTVV